MKSVITADNHLLIRAGVRAMRPDLLPLDLNMSGAGGFDVVHKLKAVANPMRVVILSMYAAREFVESARGFGCAGFVAKED